MSDEIPLSDSEKAFFEAMNKTDEDTEEMAEQPTTVNNAEAEPTTNGHHVGGDEEIDNGDEENEEENDSDDSGPIITTDNVERQEDKTTPDVSSRSSVDPSNQIAPITSVGADVGVESTVTPVPGVNASIGENTEPAISIPTTPQPQATGQTKSVSPVASGPAASVTATIPHKTITSRRKRLPQDVVGQFEDRIEDDPKGDIEAWMGLVEEYQKKGKVDDARAVYERFFLVFPTAAQYWIEYIKMELNNTELLKVENIFSRCLLTVQNVDLWSLYLDYIRRRNDLTNDPTGKSRGIISQAYDFVLSNVGHDPDSGRIWRDQIAFVKSGPGVLGGTGWLDQQKMDNMRRVYQKAINQPVEGVDLIWKEYGEFENNLNKMTARKFQQDRSAAYMTARTAYNRYCVITTGLRRETTPRLQPAPGYEGEDDWNYQFNLWKKWIDWEKEDPLVLKTEDPAAYRERVVYVCKQAFMAMQFAPQIWYDAAEFCFNNEMESKGEEFLKQGLRLNPESCMLTFKLSERLEATVTIEDVEQAAIRRGQIVRKPYDELFTHLYALYNKMQAREAQDIEKLEEEFANNSARDLSPTGSSDSFDDDEDSEKKSPKVNEKEKRLIELKNKYKNDLLNLSRVISSIWINLMRVMRRIQGHGSVHGPIGGSRQVFADARKRGKITSDVYIASALIEYRCYGDPAALKIFERGMKLFPDDENFALEYLKHLININDITNARAMFETFVSKVPPEKCERIYKYFYEYEAHYGELAQIYRLEKRMAELFENNQPLDQFKTRYTYKAVDPCTFLAVVSPTQKSRPKSTLISPENIPPGHILPPIPPMPIMPGVLPSIPHPPIPGSAPMGLPPSFAGIPPPPIPPAVVTRLASPKRAADDNDNDTFSSRARKVPRSDSPAPILKGAAGRRLNQARQAQQQQQQQQHGGGNNQKNNRNNLPAPPQPTLPNSLMFLLSILPPAEEYKAVRFNPEEMVALVGRTDIPRVPVQAYGQYGMEGINPGGGGYYN